MSIITRLFQTEINRQVRHALSVYENDQTLWLGSRSGRFNDRDRYDHDRDEILRQCLEAWRLNPIARRIVGLTSQYVVGGGISVTSRHPTIARFLLDFWEHRLNRMHARVYEFCDELTRTGNLFILISTDAAGMSYLRSVPATDIEQIIHRPNDIEQPLQFLLKPTIDNPDPAPIAAYDEMGDSLTPPGTAAGGRQAVMVHYAVNRPTGAQWGESDLAPILKWLSRYTGWLEDRARLNRYRNGFLYVVKARFASEVDRIARQSALNARPPSPGSVLVTDENEEWSIINPQLESRDANEDGLALKKMLASGSGIPLHFLAEPESSTRTTAEAAGGPTFRHFEQRQEYFLWVIKDLLNIVLARRAQVDKRIPHGSRGESRGYPFDVIGADISARDNVSLSMAATNSLNVFTELRDRKLIDDSELLRLVYRFCGESVDLEAMLARGKAAPLPTKVDALQPYTTGENASDFSPLPSGRGQGEGDTSKRATPNTGGRNVDPESGEAPLQEPSLA